MSLTVDLAVRLVTSRADRNVTSDLRSLSFRSVAPGGFASCAVSLNRPLTLQPEEIALYGKLYVYDTRNGSTVWEGRLEDPGRGAGGDGQVWDIAAVGPSAHAQDRAVPIIYVDRRIAEPWLRIDLNVNIQGDVEQGDAAQGNATAVIRYLVDPAQALVLNDRLSLQYQGFRDTGQYAARISADHVEGVVSTNLRVDFVGRRAGFAGSDIVLEADNANTTAAALLQRFGTGTEFNTANKYGAIDMRLIAAGGAVAANAGNWTRVSNVVMQGSRMLRDGSEKSSGYTNATVLASEVVEDLLGRLLTQYDGTNATVATTSYAIDQLVYPDGATPDQILTDLMALEPAYFWAAWESTTSGEARFVWQAWPTTVRYDADVTDGFISPGSAADLYNAVTVRWRDPATQQIRTVRRTQTVAELTAAGLTREPAPIDLGDETGSAANAAQVGDQFLAEHQYPPNAGSLTIARPILDLTIGRMIQPWEIRPGNLIRVRGVLPHPDSLNATSRDGVTVFRVVSVEYNADTASATLELDSYSRTVARALAAIAKKPDVRRR